MPILLRRCGASSARSRCVFRRIQRLVTDAALIGSRFRQGRTRPAAAAAAGRTRNERALRRVPDALLAAPRQAPRLRPHQRAPPGPPRRSVCHRRRRPEEAPQAKCDRLYSGRTMDLSILRAGEGSTRGIKATNATDPNLLEPQDLSTQFQLRLLALTILLGVMLPARPLPPRNVTSCVRGGYSPCQGL